MLEALLKLLPEWVVPAIFGLLVWFGANYLFIAPELGRRTVENSCSADRQAYCQCIADHMIANARFDLALWTSSLGFYEVAKSTTVMSARQQGMNQCQK